MNTCPSSPSVWRNSYGFPPVPLQVHLMLILLGDDAPEMDVIVVMVPALPAILAEIELGKVTDGSALIGV